MKQIYKALSEKYNLPLDVLIEITNSQFKAAAEAIKSAEKGKVETFKNIQFPYLGKLVAKPGRIKHLEERTLKAKQKAEKEKLNNGKVENNTCETSDVERKQIRDSRD